MVARKLLRIINEAISRGSRKQIHKSSAFTELPSEMPMQYYDTDDILETLENAYDGDRGAVAAIKAITAPYAAAPDFSEMILVQMKAVTVSPEGRTMFLNMPPSEGYKQRQVADIYRYDGEDSSWSYVPIPSSFKVSEIKYDKGTFSFVSNDRIVSGTIDQINKVMFDIIFAEDGVMESETEKNFFKIPSTVTTQRQEKTAEENPPIHTPVGIMEFNERLQWFTTYYAEGSYSFELIIDVDSRDEVLKLLPSVQDMLARFEMVDSDAKVFAADELIELKNNAWLEDDEEPVSMTDFISRIAVESVSFDADGEFEVCYADDNLFGGHSIIVYCDRNGKPARAEMAG